MPWPRSEGSATPIRHPFWLLLGYQAKTRGKNKLPHAQETSQHYEYYEHDEHYEHYEQYEHEHDHYKCPKSMKHSHFYDWKSHLKLLERGDAVKPWEEKGDGAN